MNRRVVVVTGGGGGIGAAIAEELGRQGAFVVTVDPLVTLDGSEQLPAPEETTAGRIVASGGAARASNVSVTDADAVNALFDGLVDEFGAVDAVVNVAGISRPTSFARGTEEDWRRVLDVHLNGYRNVLEAALPLMAEARHGRILGVTSGSGWRDADTGAYGCAKRAVASLTWQLGWQAPPGVVVNAVSPIAVTRMVTAALAAASPATAASGAGRTGGLSLGSMPEPEELGPLAAYLISDEFSWCSGEVVFAGGSEIAVVEPPRLLEVTRAADVASLPHALEALGPAFAAAETSQRSGGGSNPRFPGVFSDASGELPPSAVSTCAVASDRPELAAALVAALEARKVAWVRVGSPDELAASGADAAVVAFAGTARGTAASEWERTLIEHEEIVEQIYADARWARAAADAQRPMRLVTLTDASTAGGRSRAQAAAQLARPSRKATKGAVAAFAVSVEGNDAAVPAEVAAYLVCSPDAIALSGAELVTGAGWIGVRSHPRPSASLAYGGGAIPDWFDAALRAMVR